MSTEVANPSEPAGLPLVEPYNTRRPLQHIYPGIEAKFCMDKYLLRQAMLASLKSLNAKLPTGFPTSIDTPAVWCAKTLDVPEIVHRAGRDDIEEIEAALAKFNGQPAWLRTLAYGSSRC